MPSVVRMHFPPTLIATSRAGSFSITTLRVPPGWTILDPMDHWVAGYDRRSSAQDCLSDTQYCINSSIGVVGAICTYDLHNMSHGQIHVVFPGPFNAIG